MTDAKPLSKDERESVFLLLADDEPSRELLSRYEATVQALEEELGVLRSYLDDLARHTAGLRSEQAKSRCWAAAWKRAAKFWRQVDSSLNLSETFRINRGWLDPKEKP